MYSDIGEIRIFSRDEKKQDDMRHELQAKHPDVAKKVKFYIRNVKDLQSVHDAMPGVDFLYVADDRPLISLTYLPRISFVEQVDPV